LIIYGVPLSGDIPFMESMVAEPLGTFPDFRGVKLLENLKELALGSMFY
jgi:hypothetical protein